MKSPQEIASELNQFYGSATLYKHWLSLKYTEGIQYKGALMLIATGY
ncbi:MAG: DUF6876 family protein [Rivularia sp. (in: cyanobacteria)]